MAMPCFKQTVLMQVFIVQRGLPYLGLTASLLPLCVSKSFTGGRGSSGVFPPSRSYP